MADTTFRQKVTVEETPEVSPKGKETTRGEEGERQEVPYLEYEREHYHPFSVDYFKIGETWDDPKGGFPEEIAIIEEYFQNKIETGEIANDLETVKKELKRMEKLTNVKDEPRAVVKIETLAAYIKFLMDTDKIKINLRRYGHH